MDIMIIGNSTELDRPYEVTGTLVFQRCRDLGLFLETHIACLKNNWRIIAVDNGNDRPRFDLQITSNKETRRYAAILTESYIAGWTYAHICSGNSEPIF